MPTMRAAVMDKPMSISIKEVDLPVIQADEALVRVHCIGICGSDIHYYEHGRIGRYVVEKPIILGHELAGDVVQVGAAVQGVKVGDRVAVEPGIPCDRCVYCKSGRYNLCPDVRFMATPPIDGAWAEYVGVRTDFLHKLPDGMSYEEGAMLEPLSVGVHAMVRGRVAPGDRVFVSGLGPVGNLAVVAARMFGASQVIGSDIVPLRRDVAGQLGADATVDPLSGNVAERIDELTGGKGVSVVIETSGNAKSASSTIEVVRPGGRVVFVGLPATDEIPINIPMLVDKEIDAMGVFRYANTYPRTVDALQQRDYGIEKIITHRFLLADIKEACEVARTNKNESIKVMIYPE